MAKSLRSKWKRKMRAQKRQKNGPKELARLKDVLKAGALLREVQDVATLVPPQKVQAPGGESVHLEREGSVPGPPARLRGTRCPRPVSASAGYAPPAAVTRAPGPRPLAVAVNWCRCCFFPCAGTHRPCCCRGSASAVAGSCLLQVVQVVLEPVGLQRLGAILGCSAPGRGLNQCYSLCQAPHSYKDLALGTGLIAAPLLPNFCTCGKAAGLDKSVLHAQSGRQGWNGLGPNPSTQW